MINKSEFNGLTINDVSLRQFVDIVQANLISDEDRSIKVVVTPNIDHFQRLSINSDTAFVEAYERADFRLCDSRIVKILSYLKGNRINNVVPGSDLTRDIIASQWIKNYRVTIIGSDSVSVIELKKQYSLSKIEHHNPPMGFTKNPDEVEKCVDFIHESNPDLVFLAVGSPAQEIVACRLLDKYQRRNNANFFVFCIGASLDFLTGKQKRAPAWMQKLSLEWLFRALSNPKRLLPRYIKNFSFVLRYLISTH
ncbi:WecB/TagA/CpsF family glycosyltransferase [Pantoea sp. AS-PWVM4]|uniref:WecB/TagA/CpsF family glycosyltransferase n=1 Tax=Pantoea sp. AS-PWVM4 TaxID=1332069 RepID=UPI0006863ECD|nr:WecB/TagA/CpsF family glycosyltransferase [Pantoea sp. AS-PWVM4]